MLSNIKDSQDKAKRIYDQLVDIFAEQDINPTPLNYYVWYAYFKGENPKFRQEMDKAQNDPFGYTDRLGVRLYQEYLSDENPADTEFDRAFKRLLQVVIQRMNIWSSKIEKQTADLDQATASLNKENLDASELKEITKSVLNTASDMKKNTADFQKEILDTNDEIMRLRKQLIEARAETMTDELTEIGNRKAFNMSISELTEAAEENPESLQIIMTDIDHFKRFNDSFGHLVGDSVLRYFSNLMKKSKQDNETICRYGGEEFAILLADSTMEKAQDRAESIRHSIEIAKLKRKDSEKTLGTITASFGIAAYRGQKYETIEEFIKRADDALYKAKNNGRNQVVVAETPEAND